MTATDIQTSGYGQTFNALQDGAITAITTNDNTLQLEIYIPHIASRISDGFTKIFIALFDCQELFFSSWAKKDHRISSHLKIASLKPVIVSGDLNKFNFLEIEMEVLEPIKSVKEGGILFIQCSGLQCYDEEFNRIPRMKLLDLSEKHWYDQRKKY